MLILIFAIIIGLIPAYIARSKGGTFILWWIYGAALFIVALPHAILMKRDSSAIEARLLGDGMKKCPFCAEIIKEEAIKCRHCGSDLPKPEIEKQIRVNEIDAAQADAFKKAIGFISSGERSLLVGVLNSGIDVNVVDINGKTLLDYAEESGNGEIVKILLNRKARRGNPMVEEEKPRQVEIIPAPFGAMPPDKK